MFQDVKVDFRSLQTQFQDDITELGMLFKPSPEHTVPGIRSKLHLQALAVWCNTEIYTLQAITFKGFLKLLLAITKL